MRCADTTDHLLFIDEQARADLAFGCLVEAHTWEAFRDAIERVAAFDPLRQQLAPVALGGLRLG